MPRLFVAVDLPEALCRRLAAFCGGVPGARWLPVEQFHLTLRFIGEVDNGAFDDIAEALDDVHIEPFSLALSGVGHFPPRGTPRVLWVGVDDGAAAVRLHDKIEMRLQRLGLEPDARRFHPHITLARLKGAPLGKVRDFLAAHADFASEPVAVDAFHLYSSKLGAGGALHRIEASYDLSAAA
ncbi:MAG: RNA 2',3'-cyclic phosphodiesterase [Alphaproteobacteria bacterium]